MNESGGCILRQTMTTSALYGLIDNNLKHIIDVLEKNIDACLEAKSFKDPTSTPYLRTKVINIVSGLQVFKPVSVLLAE